MKNKEINVVLQSNMARVTHVKVASNKTDVKSETEKEIPDILYAVRPFYTILKYSALQKVTFHKNTVTETSMSPKIYSFIIALLILIGQMYMIYRRFSYAEYRALEPAKILVELLSFILPTLISISSLVMSASVYQKLIVRMLLNFQLVDIQLNIQTLKNYKTLRRRIIFVMTCVVLITLGMYYYDYKVWDGDFRISVMPMVSTLKELSLLELCLLILVISFRVDALNKQLENTKYVSSMMLTNEVVIISNRSYELSKLSGTKTSLKTAKKKAHGLSDSEEYTEDLTRIMIIYDRLADNANIVSSCFGLQLLSGAISAFINILYTLNAMIDLSTSNRSDFILVLGNVLLWCFRDISFLVIVTITCEILQDKVKATLNIVNKLIIRPKRDPKQQDLLERFSQLISSRDFTISACNFFPFDFTFIYSLAGAIAAYTVIILQVSQSTTGQNSTGQTMTTKKD